MSGFKSGRGGRRKGAGRPLDGDEPKVRVAYRLAADVVEYLRGHNEPAARIIEKAVRAWRDREGGQDG